jgi:hypothetical protein
VRTELLALIAAFAVASALAGVVGAINTGTAFFFGQMAFAAAVVWILLRRP